MTTSMLDSDPTRRARRRRAVVAAIIGSVVLLLVLAKVGATLVGQHLGERAWRVGDHSAAQRWFGLSDRVNVAQRWISPYNLGVTAYSGGEWRTAADRFAEAAETAPAGALCRVLLNQSLALESWGDALERQGDTAGAARSYRLAQSVLGRAEGCDSAGASSPDTSDSSDASDSPDRNPSAKPSDTPSSQDPSDDTSPSGDSSESADAEPGEQSGKQSGDEPGDASGEPEQSEQEQVAEATQRLEQKVSDGRVPDSPQETGESAQQKADRLAQRTSEGAREQQEAADDTQPADRRPAPSGRTW